MAVVRGDVPAAREASARRGLPVDWLGWTACALAAAGFALVLAGWLAGGVAFSLPWAPTLDLRLSFALDGLGALYALLATGVGALVFAYGTRYLTAAPRARGQAGGGAVAVLAVDGAVRGGDGGAGHRAGPRAAVRVLRPHRRLLVLPHRLRPRPARGSHRRADGSAGHGGQRRRDARRRGAALRRVRHVLDPRADRARRAGPGHHDRGGAAGGGRAGQERAGSRCTSGCPARWRRPPPSRPTCTRRRWWRPGCS